MTVPDLLTISSFLIAAFVIIYSCVRRDQLSRFMSVKKLGVFERDLPELKQVVVLANKVEKPSSTLEEAVEDNFREGVKYLFLVSHSNAEQELNGYYLIFEALAKIGTGKAQNPMTAKDVVDIKRLPYDWPDVPYIFYQYQRGGDEDRYTIGFRGNQKGEGIAEFYEQLPKFHSQAIFLSLLAEAPAEIKANLKIVDNVTDISELNKTGNNRG